MSRAEIKECACSKLKCSRSLRPDHVINQIVNEALPIIHIATIGSGEEEKHNLKSRTTEKSTCHGKWDMRINPKRTLLAF